MQDNCDEIESNSPSNSNNLSSEYCYQMDFTTENVNFSVETHYEMLLPSVLTSEIKCAPVLFPFPEELFIDSGKDYTMKSELLFNAIKRSSLSLSDLS